MNIFFLHRDPVIAAQMQCDKHVVKMVLETAQLLCTAHGVLDNAQTPYKPTHKNHPSAIWVRHSYWTYSWTVVHFSALLDEYTHRYNKIHKCKDHLHFLQFYPHNLSDDISIDPPQCMPDEYKRPDTVEAYRNYYKHGKAHLLKYTNREAPEWLQLNKQG